MRIRAKINLGFAFIIMGSGMAGYLQFDRAQQSMDIIDNFSNESIPELLKNQQLYALAYKIIFTVKYGERCVADSLYYVALEQLEELEEWETEDEEYETIVKNGDEEAELIQLTKSTIEGLYESGIRGYKKGIVLDSVKARETEEYWRTLSVLTIERMRGELLEFEKNKESAYLILDHTRSEAFMYLIFTTIIAIVIGALIAESVTSQLTRLASGFEKIIYSDVMDEIKVKGNDEIKKLSEAFNIMVRNLRKSFEEQENSRMRLEKLNTELSENNLMLREKTGEIETQKRKIDLQNSMLITAKTQLEESNQTLEKKVKERTRKLEQAIDELNKTVSELDRFVYSASHDLGAPLKSVMGLIHISRYEEDPAVLKQYLEQINGCIEKLENVIKDLIDFSRNSRTELEIKPVMLKELIDESISELSYTEGAKNMKIDVRLEDLTVAYSDHQRLKIILRNLLSNAIKYRDRNKEQNTIVISANQQESSWHLTVEDNGIGIKEEYIDNVFKMFYRATDQSEGSGLGLFIVSESVKKLNGTIDIQSNYGEGTYFRITFPQDPPRTSLSQQEVLVNGLHRGQNSEVK